MIAAGLVLGWLAAYPPPRAEGVRARRRHLRATVVARPPAGRTETPSAPGREPVVTVVRVYVDRASFDRRWEALYEKD